LPTYVDESGDPGIGDGCSPLFCLSAVYCETDEHQASCAAAIQNYRMNVLKKSQKHEFKSSAGRPQDHEAFFQAVADQSFHFVVAVIDKNSLPEECMNKEDVIRSAVGLVVSALHDFYLIAEATRGKPLNEIVRVDRHTDPVYFSLLRDGFYSLKSPRQPGAALVKKVKDGKSEAEDLIQLADMVCGAARRNAEGKCPYYHLIARKRIACGG
jgi:hypothetical protein